MNQFIVLRNKGDYMKKFILLLSALLIMNPSFAKTVKVEALSDFSTANPPNTWKLKVIDSFVADNGISVHANTIVEGDIIDVTSPKRLKRAASFTFVPRTYYDPQVGYTEDVKRDFKGKYSSRTEITPTYVVKKGAITAGSILVGSFVAPAVGLVEGAVKNNEGNRAKSAVVSAYENTPLSYASKGKELEFKKGQVFLMNFKLKSEAEAEELEVDKPNYSYEIVNE